MALTEPERAKIRMYMGWSPRYFQEDVVLEQAMNAVNNLTDTLPLIQNILTGSPPGVIAALEDVDAKIVLAHGRLKANTVGPITLNRDELRQLYREGKRLTSRLATLLGVEVIRDVWSGRLPRTRATHWGNYQVQG